MQDSVLLALLPQDDSWCHASFPHMTLFWGGKLADFDDTAQSVMRAARRIGFTNPPLALESQGVETFGGTDQQVEVLTLRPSARLRRMRSKVEQWSVSQYDYQPHVTLGPVGTRTDQLPSYVTFDRLQLRWGRQDFVYFLSGEYDY